MEQDRLVTTGFRSQDDDQEYSLRPKTLVEYIGQKKIKDSLSV